MNNIKKRILSAFAAAVVAVGSIVALPETGIKSPFVVEAGANGDQEYSIPVTWEDVERYLNENGEEATAMDYTLVEDSMTSWTNG